MLRGIQATEHVEFLQFLHGDIEVNAALAGDGKAHKTALHPHAGQYKYVMLITVFWSLEKKDEHSSDSITHPRGID